MLVRQSQMRRGIILANDLPATVVFDIDGVLCDSDQYTKDFIAAALEELGPCPEGEKVWNWISPYSGWDNYHPYEQPSIQGWAALLKLLYIAGYYIVILTSRTDATVTDPHGRVINKREKTLEWLDSEDHPYDEFIMWGGPDECSYDEFKVNKINELNKRLSVVLAIDDHEGHCEAYKTAGTIFLHAHPDSLR